MQKGLNASKFVPKWGGPYIISEAYDSGYYLSLDPTLKVTLHPSTQVAQVYFFFLYRKFSIHVVYRHKLILSGYYISIGKKF